MELSNFQKYIKTSGEKFVIDTERYVLKNIDEVLFHSGDKVVFQDYIFYIDCINCNGYESKIYATKKEYLKKTNTFCIKTKFLQKIVPVEKLDEEYKLYKEMKEYWAQNYNGYYSDDSEDSEDSNDSEDSDNSDNSDNSNDLDNSNNSNYLDDSDDFDNSDNLMIKTIQMIFMILIIFYFLQ